jgi:hypothetical protein
MSCGLLPESLQQLKPGNAALIHGNNLAGLRTSGGSAAEPIRTSSAGKRVTRLELVIVPRSRIRHKLLIINIMNFVKLPRTVALLVAHFVLPVDLS